MNAAVNYRGMSKDEFTAAVVANFPYSEANLGDDSRMLNYVHERAPGASSPSSEEWRGLMKRAIEKAFRNGGLDPMIIDAIHSDGGFSHRTQCYVIHLAFKLFVDEFQRAEAA